MKETENLRSTYKFSNAIKEGKEALSPSARSAYVNRDNKFVKRLSENYSIVGMGRQWTWYTSTPLWRRLGL